MTEMQSGLLNIMKWLDAFCEEKGVTYYAMGGTVLGAIRHKGFIPWDDDIDIGVPRPDYDILIEALKEVSDGRYRIENHTCNDEYIYPFSKLYDTQTTLIEDKKSSFKRGIYIDIFPLDGVGQTKEEGIKTAKKIDKVTRRLRALTYSIKESDSLTKKLYYKGMRLLSPFMASKAKLLKKIEALCKKKCYYEEEFVGNMVESWGQRKVMAKEVYGTPQRVQFEDMQICVHEDYEAYLTIMYKKWWELPPEDKRVSQHEYLLLDMNKSYLED